MIPFGRPFDVYSQETVGRLWTYVDGYRLISHPLHLLIIILRIFT